MFRTFARVRSAPARRAMIAEDLGTLDGGGAFAYDVLPMSDTAVRGG